MLVPARLGLADFWRFRMRRDIMFRMERPGRAAAHEADLSEGSQRMYLGPRGRGCCAAAEQGVSGDAKCMVRSLHVHMVPYSCASSCRNTQVERHKHG